MRNRVQTIHQVLSRVIRFSYCSFFLVFDNTKKNEKKVFKSHIYVKARLVDPGIVIEVIAPHEDVI